MMKVLPRLSALTILVAHSVGAIAWLWFMPGGFPITHPRFWTNRAGPILVTLIVIAATAARMRQRVPAFHAISLTIPFAWFGAATSGILTFPISARILAPIAIVGATIMYLSLRPLPSRSRAVLGALGLAFIVGAVLPPLERAGAPRTIPSDISIDPPPPDALVQHYVPSVRLRGDVGVSASGGQVNLNVGRVQIEIAPLLTFISRSPDRCWTIFSPRAHRVGPPRELVAMHHTTTQRQLNLWYRADDLSQLSIDASAIDRIQLDARTRLPKPVFSHLNSFTEIAIVGHRKLRLSFSPCPDVKIDVKYADYPFGAPIRFAYFDAAAKQLRIVEATDAEKGPFHELASGPIARGDPMTITLFDGDVRVAAITLHDFIAQASEELSPTAGWCVPTNSIAFSLADKNDRSPAAILISLADTGVGRGYDSIGHAAGVYRNRMTVEPATADSR